MENLAEKVRRSIPDMIKAGDKVLVAVSGGADSVALVHLLSRLTEEFKFSIAVAHLNHGMRGQEAVEDAQFVARLGRELGVETVIETIDVQKQRSLLKTSIQETARIFRYRFLESACTKVKGTRIALGHTADDQVETMLMNLLRGSGLTGLAGMQAGHGCIIRPLYECSRAEVGAWVRAQGLEYRSDSSNQKTDYLRNRVRIELIPFLETYNPQIRSNLLETSRIIRDEDAYLDALARKRFQALVLENNEDCMVNMSISDLIREPPALQKRLIRQAIQTVVGDLRRVSAHHIGEILGLFINPRQGKELHLPKGLVVRCMGKTLEFTKNPDRFDSILTEECFEQPIELNVPGWTSMQVAAVKFHAEIIGDPDSIKYSRFQNRAYLDFEKTGKSIQVRFFRPGDRFVPLGMKGKKKLKAFFIDRKVPRIERRTVPILTTQSGDIIWVYEHRISENYRVTDKTRKILIIEGVGIQ